MNAMHAQGSPQLRRRLAASFVAIVGSYLVLAGALGLLLPRYASSVRHIVSESAPTIRLLSELRTDDAQIESNLFTHGAPDAAAVSARIDAVTLRADGELAAYERVAPAAAADGEEIRALQHAFVTAAQAAVQESPGESGQHLEALRRHDALDQLLAARIELMLAEAASTDRSVRGHLRLLAQLVLLSTVVVAAASLWLLRSAVRAVGAFEQGQAARAREAEDRARELDLFAAAVAHDLRQPLGALGLVLHSVESESLPPKLITAVQIGQRSIFRLDGMIKDLLEFARGGGEPTSDAQTRIEELASDLTSEFSLRATDRARLLVELEPELCVPMKAGVVRTILLNLIDNAVNHALPEASVTIRLSGRRVGQRVQLAVADDGPGIPPELLSHVFERFRRGRSSSGYGLGLATVHRIVTAHRGTIEVESTPGQGTRFVIEIEASVPA